MAMALLNDYLLAGIIGIGPDRAVKAGFKMGQLHNDQK